MERIDSSPDQIISAAIMAGFLPLAETGAERGEINTQLEEMWEDGVQYSYKIHYNNTIQFIRCANTHSPSRTELRAAYCGGARPGHHTIIHDIICGLSFL